MFETTVLEDPAFRIICSRLTESGLPARLELHFALRYKEGVQREPGDRCERLLGFCPGGDIFRLFWVPLGVVFGRFLETRQQI